MQSEEKQSSSKLKKKWFDFTMQLVSNEVKMRQFKLSMNLYILFIIIESLQFIGYHNNGLINYNSLGFDYLGNLLKYINFLPLMLTNNINIFLVPLFTVLIIIHIVLLAVGFHTYHKKIEKMNKSVEDRDFRKNKLEYFINLLMISFSTFLTIPICQTAVSSIYCQNTAPFTMIQDCYSSTQICIAILGVINIIWLVVINLYFSLYYYNRNPFSANFLTCSSNWWNLGKFIVKVTPTLYFSYDPFLAYPVLFMITMNASYAGYIAAFRFLFPFYRYNFHLEKIIFYIEANTLSVNLCFVAIYAMNATFQAGYHYQKNIFFIAWTVSSLILTQLALNRFINTKRRLIVDIHSLEKIKLDNVLQYLIYLIFQTERNLDSNLGGFFVANIAKTHKDVCQKVDCYCNTYFQKAKEKDYNKSKQTFYTIILAIIDRVMDENRKLTSFYILKAYILYYKMESQIKAATTIAIIMMDKLDFSDEMLVKGLLFQLNNQYTDTRDMEIYRKFNEYLLLQEEQSMKLVNLYIQYWDQLIDQSSSIPKLHNILISIKRSKQQLGHIVQTSLGIYRNHVRVLLLYKNFLKEVLNDYVGYLRYQQKYKVGLKQHKLTNVDAVNMIQFRPNQNLLVINFTRRLSVHNQIMGNFQILNISSNVKQVLGFTNAELKDQSLNKMIPRIYHAVHDTFIDQILDKKDAEIVSFQYRIFPLNSNGHIKECNIISKFMPSVTCGINIVSFIQECDTYKDQFFIIYDKNTGIVDAMNEEAEKNLKDASRRKTSDMMAIPDHINDLMPHWDYKNQVWKDHIGRGKSLKSINSGSQLKYELKSIDIVRSDGLENKYIKILKFKGDFFMKMFSFENNFESYKQSNTIQQYLEYQKQANNYSKVDSNQLQEVISANESQYLIERDKEKKSSQNKLEKNEKTRQLIIQPSPPKFSKIFFILIQCLLFFSAISLTVYQIILSNSNIKTYNQDSQLLYNVNNVQFMLSDATFIFSLITTQMAYASNMSLPYNSFQSSIELLPEVQQFDRIITELKDTANIIGDTFIQKIQKNQLDYNSLVVQVKYLLSPDTQQYYLQTTDIIQACYQYASYAKDLSYQIVKLNTPIQTILKLPNFFFIFANNIEIIPLKLLKIKDSIIESINNQLNQGFKLFLAIKLLNSVLIFMSILAIILYYKYIFNNYITEVLKMYQSIKIQQIRLYQQKCKKYKRSLTTRPEAIQGNDKDHDEPQNGFSNIQQEDEAFKKSEDKIVNDDEQSKILLKKQQMASNLQQQLSFQSVPKIWKRVIIFVVWTIIYGVLLFAICYVYSGGTDSLKQHIITLNKYSISQNSVVQMRFFSQLSLNMLNFWHPTYLQSINAELQGYFTTSVKYMDDRTLNYTQIKPQFARKYEEMRFVQSLVLNKNTQQLNTLASQIQAQLEDMDYLIQYVNGQSQYFGPLVEQDALAVGTTMNICIALQFIFILLFWYFGIKSAYQKLLREHQNTFEMFNIISYNLRKQIGRSE